MVTLQDLKWIVKQPDKEEKAPTARHLLGHGKRVVSMENGGDVQLLVFFPYMAAAVIVMRATDGRFLWTPLSLRNRSGMCA